MNISDFPIKLQSNKILNCKNKILLDFDNSTKEELFSFIKENIIAINYGKRAFLKRVTKTIIIESLKDAKDVASWDFLMKGWQFSKKEEAEMELTVIQMKDKTINSEKNRKREIMYLNKK